MYIIKSENHFYFNLVEKAAPHTLQSSAKKRLKVQNTEFLKKRFHGKNLRNVPSAINN